MSLHTFVIAEAGSCHDGYLEQAFLLIEAAARAGADACKFQFMSSPRKVAKRRHAPAYRKVYERYRVHKKQLPLLKAHCDAVGIEFMCTVYLPEDIEVVAPLVKRFKVASFEAGDTAFVEAYRTYNKPLIISTGMAGGGQQYMWGDVSEVSYLHCVSAYPCPIGQANLRAIALGFDGYSDHTANVLTGALAVAAGASILEVHFRLDDTDPANPDYATALRPKDLIRYVRLVRLAETMMGDGVKRPQPVEAAMMPYRVTG